MRRSTTWASALLFVLGTVLCACGDTPRPAPEPRVGTRSEEAPRRSAPPVRETPPDNWPPEAERRLEADHAPTPFTPAQIRAGCPSGLRSTYVMEGGGRKVVQIWAFDNADETGVDFTMTKLSEDGTPQGTPRTSRTEWTALQRHADYPTRYTEITNETVTVPAGTFFCMHYRVSEPDDGKISVGDFWFAYDLPGAPVKWVQSVDGLALMTMELDKREIEKD